MSIEKSKGKARPTLPRSRSLTVAGTAAERTDVREPSGRFGKGNQAAKGSTIKRVIAKALALVGLQGESALVVADTKKLMASILADLPSDGATVRQSVYGQAREAALASYYDAKANEAGLDTERGMMLVDRATEHRKRAERLAVTALDLASKLAQAERGKPFTWTPASLTTSPRLLPAASPTDDAMPEVEVEGQEWFAAPTSADPGLSWFITPRGVDVVEGPPDGGPFPAPPDTGRASHASNVGDTHDDGGRVSEAYTSEPDAGPKTGFRNDGTTRPIPREPLHPLARAVEDERVAAHRQRAEALEQDRVGVPIQHRARAAAIGVKVQPAAKMSPELEARINAMQSAIRPRQRSALGIVEPTTAGPKPAPPPQWGQPMGTTPERRAELKAKEKKA